MRNWAIIHPLHLERETAQVKGVANIRGPFEGSDAPGLGGGS